MQDAAFIQLLLTRLERVSADSTWAHRASGLRGALLHMQTKIELGNTNREPEFNRLLELGFEILNRAAAEKIR
jgi:hypothetical protein